MAPLLLPGYRPPLGKPPAAPPPPQPAEGGPRPGKAQAQAADEHQQEQQLAHIVHRISVLVKCFKGDLGGDYARTAVVLGTPGAVASVHCRVRHDALEYMVALLRTEFTVVGESAAWPAQPFRSFMVVGGVPAQAVRLQVFVGCRMAWRTHWAAFDVDLLSVDSERVCLRASTPAMRTLVDRLSFVVQRVHAARFCLLDGPARPGAQPAAAMRAAAELLSDPRREWVMDDALGGRDAWVLARWARLVAHPETVRPIEAARLAVEGAPPLARDTVCALCHEPFGAPDIVANLGCGHSFHAACPSLSAGKGLCSWVETNPTCPCCRAPVNRNNNN